MVAVGVGVGQLVVPQYSSTFTHTPIPTTPPQNAPAMRQPSMSLCGSLRMISRSLHVPGSDSSAFTTRKDGRPSVCGFVYVVGSLCVNGQHP